MRTLLVVTLALTLAPLVAANQAPIPSAHFQPTAVLNEPVTFTSASVDPDGSIVATTWEFSDGRQKSGETVTYAFGFGGVHTITLRVTDDSGATSSKELQLTVFATLMHGRAVGGLAGGDAFADTGEVATDQHTDRRVGLAAVDYGGLRVAGMDARLFTVDDRSVARADVEWLYVPLPIGYALLTGIEAESIVGCDFPTIANAKYSQVRLNDAPIVPPGEVPPNTAIALPGGALLELNVQEWIGDRLAVTAVRVTSADGAVTELARAEAGVTHCPWQ